MNQKKIVELYELLPAVYRIRDGEQEYPLRELLDIISEQVDIVKRDIDGLWDDLFVETCASWVVPYIGYLVGSNPLFDSSRIRQLNTAQQTLTDLAGPRLTPEVALRGRADVAKTIYYRRRKGVLPMLEELARDITGWASHAVAFFELLGWAQYVENHLRMQSLRTSDIRRVEPIDKVNGPFDTISHTVDVRPISQLEGWYNIRNIGFFLWRLRSYELKKVHARLASNVGNWAYHFSPLGNPAPLFSRWRREGDEAGLATEFHVPGPIRPAAFYEDLKKYLEISPGPGFTEFYGLFDEIAGVSLPKAPGSSLMVFRDNNLVPPEDVRCMNLSTWRQPSGQLVGVDVRLGRMAFGTGWEPKKGVDVFYHYGFSADLGGGPYERRAWQVRQSLADLILVDESGQTLNSVKSLTIALDQWKNKGKRNTIISIVDNRTYEETISIEPEDGNWLVMEAAGKTRPHLKLNGPLEITGNHPDSSVTLSGLLIEGAVHITGSLGKLRILHSTLVPGLTLKGDGSPSTSDPSLIASGGTLNTKLRVEIAFSIVGPVRLPDHVVEVWMVDSVLDGLGGTAFSSSATPAKKFSSSGTQPKKLQPGPPVWMERVTVLGSMFVKELRMANEVIFSQLVVCQRRQGGCVRFSFVPDGSSTPRRYRCQPDLEIEVQIEAAERSLRGKKTKLTKAESDLISAEIFRWLLPAFTSTRYGDPGYVQLSRGCPQQIRTGAEDESEMGAFSHLKQPQRESNLRLRLKEYLPFGLQPGIIYVT